MRTVTETRTCDRCKKKMYTDTGVWIGAEVTAKSYSTEIGAVELIPRSIDLCPRCEQELMAWLKP